MGGYGGGGMGGGGMFGNPWGGGMGGGFPTSDYLTNMQSQFDEYMNFWKAWNDFYSGYGQEPPPQEPPPQEATPPPDETDRGGLIGPPPGQKTNFLGSPKATLIGGAIGDKTRLGAQPTLGGGGLFPPPGQRQGAPIGFPGLRPMGGLARGQGQLGGRASAVQPLKTPWG